MATHSAAIPGRVWTGLVLMIAAAIAHFSTFIVMSGSINRMTASIRSTQNPATMDPSSLDPSTMFYCMGILSAIAAILGLLGLVLTVAGFIDYSRSPRPWQSAPDDRDQA
jgi:hypothetical protein